MFLGIYIAAAASNKFKEKINDNNVIVINPNPSNILIISLMTFAQIYITIFIHKFYNLLPVGRMRSRVRITSFAD